MKNTLFLLTLAFMLVSCTAGRKAAVAVIRDGTSIEKAVIIHATHEREGINAENIWITEHYPGYMKTGQSLVFEKKCPFDIITISNSKGDSKKIYFDISKFFGKP